MSATNSQLKALIVAMKEKQEKEKQEAERADLLSQLQAMGVSEQDIPAQLQAMGMTSVEPAMVPEKTVEVQNSPLFSKNWADDSSDEEYEERDETPAPAPLSFAERTAAYCPPQQPKEDGFKTITKKKTKKAEAKELPPWTIKANLPKVEVENQICHIVALDNEPKKVEFSYAHIGNYKLVLINRSDETFIVVWGDIPEHVKEVSFQAKFENWTDCKIDKVPVIDVCDRAFKSQDDMLEGIGNSFVTFE